MFLGVVLIIGRKPFKNSDFGQATPTKMAAVTKNSKNT